MAHGVIDQVGQETTDEARIEWHQRQVCRREASEHHVARRGLGTHAFQRVGNQVGQGRGLGLEEQGAGIEARQIEEVVDQPAQFPGAVVHGAQVAGDRRLVGDDTVGDGLDDSTDGGERRAQVVRDGGDEVAARLFHAPLLPCCGIKPHGQSIEVGGQIGQLVVRVHHDAGLQITVGNARGAGADARERTRDGAGQQVGQHE